MAKTNAELPKVELATKEYVLMELKDTENRIEKAFHDQTKYLDDKYAKLNTAMDQKFNWVIGIMLAGIVAIVAAVFFK